MTDWINIQSSFTNDDDDDDNDNYDDINNSTNGVQFSFVARYYWGSKEIIGIYWEYLNRYW